MTNFLFIHTHNNCLFCWQMNTQLHDKIAMYLEFDKLDKKIGVPGKKWSEISKQICNLLPPRYVLQDDTKFG